MKKAKANKIVDYLVVITKNKKRDQWSTILPLSSYFAKIAVNFII